MRLSDALAATLRDWQVEYVFGVSGANIEHFHDSIHRLGHRRLHSILAKSEIGAAFMADARARVHKTLGVCCSTSGGGMMNLAVGVAESFAESVPVLAIVGQVPSQLEGRGGFQDSSGLGRTVDALLLFRSIAKYVSRVDGHSFWPTLRAAVASALQGRQGPAVLLVPRDAFDQEVGDRPADMPPNLADFHDPAISLDVGPLSAAIRGARHPVLMLGTGVDRAGASPTVEAFARRAGIPVVTTMSNPATFPQDDPLFLGCVGVAGHPSAHAYLNHTADLIVAVGTGLNILVRQPLGEALRRAPLAVVNVDAGEIRRIADPFLVIEGDAQTVFDELHLSWENQPFYHGSVLNYARSHVVPTSIPLPPSISGTCDRDPKLSPSRAMEVLQPYLAPEGHILFDAGNCVATALHFLDIPPGATATIALGMGGMGYAIAAAIGVQIGRPRRSMVLCGDGAFLMLGMEVHTAVEYQLPILFIVLNNQSHGMCVTRQHLHYQGRTECSTYGPVDAAAVAKGLGETGNLWTGNAATEAELAAALHAYTTDHAHKPGLLDVRLSCSEMPPFHPFLPIDVATKARKRRPRVRVREERRYPPVDQPEAPASIP